MDASHSECQKHIQVVKKYYIDSFKKTVTRPQTTHIPIFMAKASHMVAFENFINKLYKELNENDS